MSARLCIAARLTDRGRCLANNDPATLARPVAGSDGEMTESRTRGRVHRDIAGRTRRYYRVGKGKASAVARARALKTIEHGAVQIHRGGTRY